MSRCLPLALAGPCRRVPCSVNQKQSYIVTVGISDHTIPRHSQTPSQCFTLIRVTPISFRSSSKVDPDPARLVRSLRLAAVNRANYLAFLVASEPSVRTFGCWLAVLETVLAVNMPTSLESPEVMLATLALTFARGMTLTGGNIGVVSQLLVASRTYNNEVRASVSSEARLGRWRRLVDRLR